MNWRVLVVLAFSLTLFACSQTGTDTLPVGAVLPLSGADSGFGNHLKRGLQLGHSRNVQLFIEDFGSAERDAVTAAKKLIKQDDVDVLLTTWSEDTKAILPLIKRHEVPTICLACGSIGITKKSKWLFRTWPSDALEVKAIVDYATSHNYRRAAVLQTQSTWEASLRREFVRRWQGDVFVQKASRKSDDFKTQLLKMKRYNPDFVYLATWEQKYPLIFKQLRQLNVTASIATTSWINSPDILNACGAYCNGAIVPQYAPPSERFRRKYERKYDQKPGIGADVAYDTINILEQIGDAEDVRTQLFSMNYTGASGRIRFDRSGNRRNRETQLFTVKNGTLTKFSE